MPGQIQHPDRVLGTDCSDLKVLDPSGFPSDLIIDAGSNFNVSVKFVLGGMLARSFVTAPAPDPFTVTYYYEGMGGAADGVLATAAGNLGAGILNGPVYEFKDAVTTPATPVTLPAPGLYKLSAVVTFGGLLSSYTAFCDGPMIRQN